MGIFVKVVLSIIALNVVFVASMSILGAVHRRRKRREIGELETLWRLKGRRPAQRGPAVTTPHTRPRRWAFVPSAEERAGAGGDETGLRTWLNQPRGRKFVAVAIVTSAAFMGTALASPAARDAFTAVLGAVGRALGVSPSPTPSGLASGNEQGSGTNPALRNTGSGSGSTPTHHLGPPTAVTASPASSTEIDVTWSDVSTETGYRVQRSKGSGGWITVATTGQNVTTYSDTGLSPTTTYYYRVIATNAGGHSPASDVGSATTLTDPPGPPTAVTAVAASSTEIDVTWSDVSTETGYRVERSPDGLGGWITLATTGQDATTYSDTGLSPTTSYYYRVFATNAGGDSPASDVGSATTLTDPPGAPTAVTAMGVSSTEIDVTWSAVASATGYRVERSPDGSSGWIAVATTGQDVTTYSDTGLSPTTTYYYRVFATNAGGDSPASDVGSATTPDVPSTPPSPPSALSAVAASSTEVDVTWSGVASATGYRVERSPDGSSGWVTVATTGPDVTTYQDTGLSPTTTYYYRVFAINAGGDSPASNVGQASTGG